MARKINCKLKNAFNSRSNLFIAIFIYIVIFIFAIDNELIRDFNDLKIKDTFYRIKINSDSLLHNHYGSSSRGSYYSVSCIIDGRKKNMILGYYFNDNADWITVLISKKRSNYVYFYPDEDFWLRKTYILIIKIIYIFTLLPLFYFTRKQHLKVKKLAPHGVDENYEPLPKPAEKFNFNKYD